MAISASSPIAMQITRFTGARCTDVATGTDVNGKPLITVTFLAADEDIVDLSRLRLELTRLYSSRYQIQIKFA